MKNMEGKLERVYRFVEHYIAENGFPPSVREICEQVGIKSTATAYSYLNRLKDMGRIDKTDSKKRALSLTDKTALKRIPLVGTVTAGTPILAVENLEGYYPLLPDFPGSDEDYFMLRVFGDSMIEAGIYDGDKIIVKRQNTADNGEIVVALIEDSATVKRFFKRENKIILHPENSALSDIVLNDVVILGIVEGLIRKF
ncbi:MAG: transcriptional repressor LexA [Firmicutes bacterium]|nr:transcriptional repressor LexA [Bacillota bacterium]